MAVPVMLTFVPSEKERSVAPAPEKTLPEMVVPLTDALPKLEASRIEDDDPVAVLPVKVQLMIATDPAGAAPLWVNETRFRELAVPMLLFVNDIPLIECEPAPTKLIGVLKRFWLLSDPPVIVAVLKLLALMLPSRFALSATLFSVNVPAVAGAAAPLTPMSPLLPEIDVPVMESEPIGLATIMPAPPMLLAIEPPVNDAEPAPPLKSTAEISLALKAVLVTLRVLSPPPPTALSPRPKMSAVLPTGVVAEVLLPVNVALEIVTATELPVAGERLMPVLNPSSAPSLSRKPLFVNPPPLMVSAPLVTIRMMGRLAAVPPE